MLHDGIGMMYPAVSSGAGARNIWGKSEMVSLYGIEKHPLSISNPNGMKMTQRRKVGRGKIFAKCSRMALLYFWPGNQYDFLFCIFERGNRHTHGV
jgi:hypothetical protein